jgi:hypothetical protein
MSENSPRREWTGSRGKLAKINLEGCKQCGRVYVSPGNAGLLQVDTGWYRLENLQQKSPGDRGLDVVLRVRGRVWNGGPLGTRTCPDCREK